MKNNGKNNGNNTDFAKVQDMKCIGNNHQLKIHITGKRTQSVQWSMPQGKEDVGLIDDGIKVL
jgi:hypothetical protein